MALARSQAALRWNGGTHEVLARVAYALVLMFAHHGDQGPSRACALDSAHDGADNFNGFFEQHEREIYGYLWRMTGDEHTAHDLTQEAFLRAWQHFNKISLYERPSSWLFRIATHLALNHRRDHAVREHMLRRLEPEPAGDATTNDRLREMALGDAVRQTLLGIPTRERAALVLHVIYGMTCAELAQMLSISPGAAKTTLWRGREHFRERYHAEENSHNDD